MSSEEQEAMAKVVVEAEAEAEAEEEQVEEQREEDTVSVFPGKEKRCTRRESITRERRRMFC